MLNQRATLQMGRYSHTSKKLCFPLIFVKPMVAVFPRLGKSQKWHFCSNLTLLVLLKFLVPVWFSMLSQKLEKRFKILNLKFLENFPTHRFFSFFRLIFGRFAEYKEKNAKGRGVLYFPIRTTNNNLFLMYERELFRFVIFWTLYQQFEGQKNKRSIEGDKNGE